MSGHKWDYNPYNKRNTLYSAYGWNRAPGRVGRRGAERGIHSDYAWWNVPGPFTGRGPNGYARSDQQIQQIVCDRLAANGLLDASGIKVEVKDCVVTLTGAVDSRRSKRIARDVVDTVFGVQDIRNELTIERDERRVQRGL